MNPTLGIGIIILGGIINGSYVSPLRTILKTWKWENVRSLKSDNVVYLLIIFFVVLADLQFCGSFFDSLDIFSVRRTALVQCKSSSSRFNLLT